MEDRKLVSRTIINISIGKEKYEFVAELIFNSVRSILVAIIQYSRKRLEDFVHKLRD